MDRRHFERLGLAHRRQDSRKARREHGFAGAGRPDHQQAVSARGGDFERALGLRLPFHLREIRIAVRGSAFGRLEARQLCLAAQVGDDFEQGARGQHVGALG